MTVGRQKLYALTSPEDVAIAYRNNTTLSWDAYLHDLLSAFGLDSTALRMVWHKPSPGDASFVTPNPINPRQRSLIHLTEDVYKKQLLPGEKLDVLGGSFLQRLERALHWDRLSGPYVQLSTLQRKHVSLKGLCRSLVVDAITRSMWGDLLHEIEPSTTQCMLDFNDDAWMVIFHYPQIMAPKMNSARRKLMNALEVYIHRPKEQRVGEAWAIATVVAAQEITGIDDQNRAAMLLMIYWA